MTNQQLYDACKLLAPDFRIGVEFMGFPTEQRFLVWHGRKPEQMVEQSAGLPLTAGNFEPIFTELLTRAYAALSLGR